MKTYLRMLRFLRPYGRNLLLTGAAILAYAVLSGVSVLSVSPFVRILFGSEGLPQVPEIAPPVPGEAVTPVVDTLRAWLASLRLQIETFLFAHGRTVALQRFCLGLLLVFLLKNLAHYAQTYGISWLEQAALRDVRRALYARISGAPLGVFHHTRTGEFIARLVNDVPLMRTALVGGAASLLRNGVMIVLAIAILVAASWKLALVASLILPPNAFLIAKIGKRLRRRSTRAQQSMSDMASVVQETVAGARVVKAFGMHAFEAQRFEGANERYFGHSLRVRRLQAMASPISEMLAISGIVAILWFGGRLVLSGELPIDRLFLFVTAMIWLADPVKALIGVNNALQEGLAAGTRVLAFLDLPQEPAASRGRTARFERALVFEKVRFGYDSQRPVLRDVDLEVRPGQIVALVGPSGAGKSTLVDLIPRFYEVSGGRILLDGVDLRELSLESLRGLLGMVTQEVILFNDTVRANIAYGLPDLPEERIRAAARAANADTFIRDLPQGYDTPIGERGVTLSGGERQRLSIARAILRDPRILILDEATSALDSQSERLIQEALDRLMHGRTAFVVAHRLSTIQRADIILVLENGRIVERGTHDDLLAASGSYARLHELQFR